MPVHINDFIEVLAEFCENKHLKAAVKESFKGGLITGCAAVAGGLLLGPIGLAIGGALGGGACAVASKRSFQPVAVILRQMTDDQKEKLYYRIKHAFRDISVQDGIMLGSLFLTNTSLQNLALKVLTDFLNQEMHLSVK